MNDSKLLYLLPDLAYVVGLLPAKKPNTFAVQSFLQINGQFMDDNDLLEGNFDKLLDRLEEGEYELILPDFLFTNTIVNVQKSSQAEAEEYVEKKLLPELGLSKEEHEIKTIVLTGYKGTYKVQLSALEKTVLEPMKKSLQGKSIKIKNVIPLSWTLKSVISLEPSISLVQMGDKVYLAQHYIGIDQTNFAPVSEVENLVETIKTLKGAEPSIQTIYLLSSELVEEKLKEGLSNTLPIQQLTSAHDSESKMPSYVKQAIESGMRTLSIPEYALPKFSIGKSSSGKKLDEIAHDTDEKTQTAQQKAEAKNQLEVAEDMPKAPVVIGEESPMLPKPSAVAIASESQELKAEAEDLDEELDFKEVAADSVDAASSAVKSKGEEDKEGQKPEHKGKTKDEDEDDDDKDEDEKDDDGKNDDDDKIISSAALLKPEHLLAPQHPAEKQSVAAAKIDVSDKISSTAQIVSLEDSLKTVTVAVSSVTASSIEHATSAENKTDEKSSATDKLDRTEHEDNKGVGSDSAKDNNKDSASDKKQPDDYSSAKDRDLHDSKVEVVKSNEDASPSEVDLSQFADNHSKSGTISQDHTAPLKKEKMIIKDNSGVNSMVKMFFVGLVSFSITVAVGVGLGLGVLSLSNKSNDPKSPVAENITPVPSVAQVQPTATPTPAPEIAKEKIDILIVNATKVAGYAGKIGDKLKTGGFTSVKTSNAKGDYKEAGFYVLMPTEDKNLVAALAKDSGLDLEFAEGYDVEDAKSQYEVVIVLAKE